MSAGTPSRLRLTRRMRLRTAADFQRLKQDGRRLAHGCLVANWVVLPPGATPRLGAITSRRLGGAAIRNRARRLLREAFRLHQHELAQPVELVLIARESIVGRRLADVEKDLLAAWRRGGILKTTT